MRFFTPITFMKSKAQPRLRMDQKAAELLVAQANAARRKGKPDGKLESRFTVKRVVGLAGIRLHVLRIDAFTLSQDLSLEPLENPALDPLHPAFDMDEFRRENPLPEGRMK
jgi:hypothetical protein